MTTEPTDAHHRLPYEHVPPRYPADDPSTWRTTCACGWTGPERHDPAARAYDHDQHLTAAAAEPTERDWAEAGRIAASALSGRPTYEAITDALAHTIALAHARTGSTQP
jgi:hypothetical protein